MIDLIIITTIILLSILWVKILDILTYTSNSKIFTKFRSSLSKDLDESNYYLTKDITIFIKERVIYNSSLALNTFTYSKNKWIMSYNFEDNDEWRLRVFSTYIYCILYLRRESLNISPNPEKFNRISDKKRKILEKKKVRNINSHVETIERSLKRWKWKLYVDYFNWKI